MYTVFIMVNRILHNMPVLCFLMPIMFNMSAKYAHAYS